MRFTPSFLDEIKARLPVSQVVGRRVRLVKAGREWKGLSPFNAEKTPSFFVNDQKQAWFDFSSGKNGNIFDFVIESEGLSFPEAVERLAGEAGLALPARSADVERQEKKRAGLAEAMEMAATYFEQELAGAKGRNARDYLAGRALSQGSRAEFRIGYAPGERHGLRDHLAAKGVDLATMVEAGLLVSGPDIPVAYDRFRNRVMFPIQDGRGRVIAFGGRTLDQDVGAKYLNSPETPLFHKGAVLFNQHRARKAAHDKNRLVVVEGYMDVIALSAAGCPETVAPLGTALTEGQLTLLWRMADEPILCFDGDKAGQRAAFRAVDLALTRLEPGKSARFAFLPQGQDPDDLARAGGAEAVEAVLGAARPLADVLWTRETAAGPLDTPERRATMERRLREVVGRIGDPMTRRHYEAEIDSRLAAFAPGGRGAGRPGRRSWPRGERQGPGRGAQRQEPWRNAWADAPLSPTPLLAGASTFSGAGSGVAQEALIVLGLEARPDILGRLVEEVSSLAFADPDARALAHALIEDHAFENAATAGATAEKDACRARLRSKLRPRDERFIAPDTDPDALEAALHQAIALHDRSRALKNELRDAERALGDDASEADLAWLIDVHDRLAALQRMPASFDTPQQSRTLERALAEAPVARRRR